MNEMDMLKFQLMDTQDSPYFSRNRCKLFLYEHDQSTNDDYLNLKLNLCDNVNTPYRLTKPVYRVCTRNFTNILDEIEKVDYNYFENEEEDSDEDQ